MAVCVVSASVSVTLGCLLCSPREKMESFAFIAAVVLAFLVWYLKKYQEWFSAVKKLPGPKVFPFVGNGLMFLGKSPSEQLELLLELIKPNKVTRLMVGPQVLVVFNDPKDVEMVLGSQKLIDKSSEYDFLLDWLGTGLLISSGQKWFSRRKVITPTFHFKILEQFVEVFDKHSALFVNNLEKFKGQGCDVFPLIGLCALDIICGKVELSTLKSCLAD